MLCTLTRTIVHSTACRSAPAILKPPAQGAGDAPTIRSSTADPTRPGRIRHPSRANGGRWNDRSGTEAVVWFITFKWVGYELGTAVAGHLTPYSDTSVPAFTALTAAALLAVVVNMHRCEVHEAVTRRVLTRTPVPSGPAVALTVTGAVIALGTATALALLGLPAGPDQPVAETVALVAVGAMAGWWLARRGGRAAAG